MNKKQIKDMVIRAIRGPVMLWCLMAGVYFLLEVSQLPAQLVNLAEKVLFILAVLSVTIVAARIAVRLIRIYTPTIEMALPVTSLTQNIARAVIFTTGLLMVLNGLGISITPILASLGVGGLAVALALQETLSNFFSGFHIIVTKQVKIGDYIKLNSGEEGYVTDINWRTTMVRALANNVILVPNAKLTQAIITNYDMPNKEIAVTLDLKVRYDSDLKKVERVTAEVGKEVMQEVSGGIPAFEPFIRYGVFADNGIHLTVILRAKEFVDQYLVKHEFIKRLHERYKKEGIIVPCTPIMP